MKRFNLAVQAAIIIVLASMPLGNIALATLDGGTPCTTNCNASSATPDDGVTLTKPQGCVTIALPLLKGDSNCVTNGNGNGGAIVTYLRSILELAGAAVGLVIVLMMIIAGIQYITSAGDSGRVKSAKDRVVGAITALILFMFMVAILQFLVPGGIL